MSYALENIKKEKDRKNKEKYKTILIYIAAIVYFILAMIIGGQTYPF